MKMRIRSLSQNVLSPFYALLVSFFVAGVIILCIGQDPLLVLTRFVSGTVSTSYGIGQVLFRATPLVFTGLSAAICFRMGLFNIGGEGQLIIGALCTAAVGTTVAPLPSIMAIPLCTLAGFAGGALWGFIPGFLKARYGSHEVINTIMLNFIASALASFMIIHYLGIPATVHTAPIPSSAELPRFDALTGMFHGSPVNVSFLIAIAAALLVGIMLRRSIWGYELRTIGASVSAAEYGGINVNRHYMLNMAIAGGIAGLVGTNFVLGYKHYFELGFSDGTGFIGIAVALLARNNPVGILFTALLFGMLEYGSLTVNTIVPKEISNILQALIILAMIAAGRLTSKPLPIKGQTS
jgi:ABC-type uncharacterized transport system permease subunit